MKRCLRAAPSPAGITVGFRAPSAHVGAGGRSCLTSAGRFRMLEAAPCATHDTSQRWSYDVGVRGFRSASDTTLCLRYFEEAKSFATWGCEATPSAPFIFRHAMADDVEASRHVDHAFCVDRPGGVAACVVVAED